MKLVLFCHPAFSKSQSMPRFAGMLQSSFVARGFDVQMWSPKAKFFNFVSSPSLAKWAGYIDQYVLFPAWVRKALKTNSPDTLFVFCDQALGPWMPLVKGRPHVVHVHDLLALRSALGDIKENPTSFTGIIYQRYIRRGFRHAQHFISVSKKTRDDLHQFGKVSALTSEYVYNGMSFRYAPIERSHAREVLVKAELPAPVSGMLLHVGGSQWYKNRPGLIALYAHYAAQEREPLPLWCIGPPPDAALKRALAKVPQSGRVLFFSNLGNTVLQAVYSYARLFIFPSLAEGFGWPIFEALACGCPVITTDEAPMNEITGGAVQYIPRMPPGGNIEAWASNGAALVKRMLSQVAPDVQDVASAARYWSMRLDAEKAIDEYLAIYKKVLERSPQFRSGPKSPYIPS